ncbi:hypothetical protein P7C70_g6453, partial [Phenoliferia sp. Uapishka_3]
MALLISAGRSYLTSLSTELPSLLVQALPSLTTSSHLQYSTTKPPSSPRLSSMSREAMLSERSIYLVFTFIFDPRRTAQRSQFELESVELLTREAVLAQRKAFEDETPQGDIDGTNASAFARPLPCEAPIQSTSNLVLFFSMFHVELAPELLQGKEEVVMTGRQTIPATMRADVFDKPGQGSRDWFQFLKDKLEAPQEKYHLPPIADVYEFTKEETESASKEVKIDWKKHKSSCQKLRHVINGAEVHAMMSPYTAVLLSSGLSYMNSIRDELAFLLVEAMDSLTTSSHLHYSTTRAPSSPRLSTMSRKAMLCEHFIYLELVFVFDPRISTPRKQFSLESIQLLTREAEMARRKVSKGGTPEGDADADAIEGKQALAESLPREAPIPGMRRLTTFHSTFNARLASGLSRGPQPIMLESMLLSATIRADAFEKPAEGSGDWFQFIKKKLEAPQGEYLPIEEGDIYEFSKEDHKKSAEEVIRRIAVALFDYPRDKAFDWDDERIGTVSSICNAATLKPQKGVSSTFFPTQHSASRTDIQPICGPGYTLRDDPEKDTINAVLALQRVYGHEEIRRVLSLRNGSK